ncbi:MAG: MFS transporter [Salinivirgaceae bacterium]
MQLPAGYLSDKTGNSKVFIYGFLGVAIATLLTGLSPVYYLIVFFQFISGILSSSFHPSTFALLLNHTSEKIAGKVLSLHSLGGNIGNAIVFLLSGLFASYFGWRVTLIIWAVPGFLIAYYFLKTFKRVANKKTKIKYNLQEPNRTSIKKNTARENMTKHMIFITLISILVGIFARVLPIFLPLYFIELYTDSIALSGILTSLYFFAGFPGVLFGGFIADKYNKLDIIIFSSGLIGIFLFIIAKIEMSLNYLVVLIVFIGFIKSMFAPAKNTLAGLVLFEKNRGFVFGLIFGGGFTGATIGTLVYGYLSDLYGLQNALMFFGIVSLMLTIVCFVYKLFYGDHGIKKENQQNL